MTLAELFHAANMAGIRLANVAGKVQIRGQSGAITPEIVTAIAEHKQTLLQVLPTVPDSAVEADARSERLAIIAEANGMTTPDQLAEAVLQWGRIAAMPRIDAKSEWLLELAVMYLRWADCDNSEVRDRLQAILDRRPADTSGCVAMVAKMREIEHDLREAGQLPSYHWPNDTVPEIDIDLDLLNW